MTTSQVQYVNSYCPFPPFVATIVVSLANVEGEETFDPTMLGLAETVVQERICGDELILIMG